MGQYTVRHQCDPPPPDGYTPDGIPIYFARGNGKSILQLRMYARLMGVSDEEFDELIREVEKKMGLISDEDDA